MPYFLHPRHISFFIIVVMEIKAVGQLHFKYYTGGKGLQRMYSKTSARKFTDPLKGNVLYWLPDLQDIRLRCTCSLFCFPVQLRVTSPFFFFNHVKDVVFLCLLMFFFYHPLMKCWWFEGGEREEALIFLKERLLPSRSHCHPAGAVPK